MTLNKELISLLTKKKIKISIAESCTGGMLSSAFTTISGSSEIFTMGFVTYSNHAKNKILKVPNNVIKKYGAVSAQCCLAMVNNLNKISKTNLCISTTGIAGPKGGSKKKPVGLVYIGVKKGNKIIINKIILKLKKRVLIQKATVKEAIKIINSVI